MFLLTVFPHFPVKSRVNIRVVRPSWYRLIMRRVSLCRRLLHLLLVFRKSLHRASVQLSELWTSVSLRFVALVIRGLT